MQPGYGRVRRKLTPSKSGVVLLGHHQIAHHTSGKYNGNWTAGTPQTYNYSAPWAEAQITEDTVHSGPPYLEGGFFRTLKYIHSSPYYGVHGAGAFYKSDGTGGFSQRYVGGFFAPTGFSLQADEYSNWNLQNLLIENSPAVPSIGSWGSKAWNSTKPKLEQAGGFVFTSEMRDIPRMLKTTAKGFSDIWKDLGGTSKSRLMQPKKLADHFLNHQFGWKPFLSDLRKFHNVIQNSSKMIDDSVARNGKWTRRRATLSSVRTDAVVGSGSGNFITPLFFDNTWYATGQGPFWNLRHLEEVDVWAVGRFKYYRPEFDAGLADHKSAWNTALRYATVSGFRVNPSNLYNAVPWTWAIDWVSNVGDHVDHLTDVWVDSVVNQYLYVMQHQKRVREYTATLPFLSGMRVLKFTREIESKLRTSGLSPYGFSLSWDDLTPRQLAIAVALGISRA